MPPKYHLLPRTGLGPLKIRGEVLSHASGKPPDVGQAPPILRWHEITVYRLAEGGAYAVWVAYRSNWRGKPGSEHGGEVDRDGAEVFDTADEVVDMLSQYDIGQDVVGYPPGKNFEERQRLLLVRVRRNFESLVSKVLTARDFIEEA